MANLNVIRLGALVIVSVSILSLAYFMFYTTNRNVSAYFSNRWLQRRGDHTVVTKTKHHANTGRKKGLPEANIDGVSKKPKGKITKNKVLDNRPNKTKAFSKTVGRISAEKKKTRYLIYLCDKHRSCGGWGDRQRGMVAAYVMAVVTGRKFGLNMSFPCDIKLFYIPNKINWFIKVNEIRGLTWEIVDWMDNKNNSVDCESDFNKLHPSDVVFLKSNQDVIHRIRQSPRYGHLVPADYKNWSAWGIGWHQLMKVSIHMEEHIDEFMSKIPDKGNLVCAHIRVRRNPTIPNDGAAVTSLPAVQSLWKFLSKYERNASRVFVATDSVDVRKSARKYFGSKELDSDGLILHIDRQGKWSDACLGFENALLEQAILTKCKVLVKSLSGFSARAAMMSTIKQKLFTFKNGTIV